MEKINKVPVIVMEEHKEAYYAWHLFVTMGKIDVFKNILLHVDHHDDDMGGLYAYDLGTLPGNLEVSKHLSYDIFGIANFILPAIYEGMFDKFISLINYENNYEFKKKFIGHVFTDIGGNRRDILDYVDDKDEEVRKKLEEQTKEDIVSNIRPFDFYRGGLTDYGEFAAPVVLDIDLDYFCWSDTLKDGEKKVVEITPDAWWQIKRNTYNAFRIAPSIHAIPLERNGRYYLEFENESIFREKDEPLPMEELKARVDKFFNWLGKQKFVPAAVDICRSRFSGYLNMDYFPWIENEVLHRLDELYGTDMIFRPGK